MNDYYQTINECIKEIREQIKTLEANADALSVSRTYKVTPLVSEHTGTNFCGNCANCAVSPNNQYICAEKVTRTDPDFSSCKKFIPTDEYMAFERDMLEKFFADNTLHDDIVTAVNRWIPCRNVLPLPLQNVIVCTNINTVTVAWLNGDHWTLADTGVGHTENLSFDEVKYWMNLPEPPKSEAE